MESLWQNSVDPGAKNKKKKERKTKTRYESRNMVLNLELCSRLKTSRNSLG